jgi:hypothetical protein
MSFDYHNLSETPCTSQLTDKSARLYSENFDLEMWSSENVERCLGVAEGSY